MLGREGRPIGAAGCLCRSFLGHAVQQALGVTVFLPEAGKVGLILGFEIAALFIVVFMELGDPYVVATDSCLPHHAVHF